MKKHKKVFVGLSGGVDSSVAATLLARDGYDVTGVYMKNWSSDIAGLHCPWREDLASARSVAAHLKIPFIIYDFEADYKRAVVDYMVDAYQKGLTPNPDVMCNQEIKFKVFAQKCFSEGAEFIATGHYARIDGSSHIRSNNIVRGGEADENSADSSSHFRSNNNNFDLTRHPEVIQPKDLQSGSDDGFFANAQNDNETEQSDNPNVILRPKAEGSDGSSVIDSSISLRMTNKIPTMTSAVNDDFMASLLIAKDARKDQTYFLYRMSPAVASKTLFPVGEYTKTQIRQLAAKFGLPTAERRDSQGLCFVGKVPLRDFLSQYIESAPGDIIDERGKVVGSHDGAFYYTIGQRHGLGVGGGAPYYVYKKDVERNIVYVTTDLAADVLNRSEFQITDCVWWSQPQPSHVYKIRLRHGGELLPARLTQNNKNYQVVLDTPARAVAPGQSAVIYDGERVLGGGVIV